MICVWLYFAVIRKGCCIESSMRFLFRLSAYILRSFRPRSSEAPLFLCRRKIGRAVSGSAARACPNPAPVCEARLTANRREGSESGLNDLFKMIVKRLLSLIVILFGLSVLTFGLTYLLPSDPVEELINSMGAGHDAEMIARLEEQYGTNRGFVEQYTDWISGVVLRGDFGVSVKYDKPVREVIATKLPYTIRLACTSFLTMVIVAFPLGILSAVYKNRIADHIIRFVSFIGVSMPSFWFGMLLIWIFAVRLGWLPVAGSTSWQHIILPTLTLSLSMICSYTRRIRAVMVEQLSEEYISGCLARGIRRPRIIFAHILPNSLLAVVTMLGMSFGSLLGGTMIVETVFSWNGIGLVCTTAITARDYALIQGYVMWMGCIYVMVNLAVDVSYSLIDPRIRRGMERK